MKKEIMEYVKPWELGSEDRNEIMTCVCGARERGRREKREREKKERENVRRYLHLR